MSVFSNRDFADHEQVVFCSDDRSGLKAIIAVHNSNLGPVLGGCRMWPYASEDEAVRDVLRLSRGMTYKSAIANLKLGGGKSVIIGNPRTDKTPELLKAFAQAVERLHGRYIAAEDSGTGVDDMKYMAQFTRHVSGVHDKPAEHGTRSGDPSPSTAYGVFVGIQAAVRERLLRDSLDGLRVAVQGLGHVGLDLARRLKGAGAELWVTDLQREPLLAAGKELGATVVAPDDIFGLDVDVFAPCAMGAVINDQTVPQLKAKIVAGAANNQLAEPRHGAVLMERGILYAPDYVINAGGIIDVYHERIGNFDPAALARHIEGIHDTLLEVFARARKEERPTGEVADAIAEERFKR
ncbi:MAG: Glu/Leu/Phe/Val dehydrogenase dimerization domain-containing protein [Aromatoleum sp.]|uniref:Glu/Leu/Phe/Val dehydrogenase dimerization domain-containing protein n=1 Tax=Aromatoleum sp. TaxID=2307007 RepID=UPI002893CB61|nr:Glu/Leu/Phe/Val dehydrogenase dimerization domain-containing protein [Aromatoleum sp.]MDT3670632.1 Glu/Leu/Phe/Val dehydrogenase dimerization domain-containing protein [Aromatoleum sp.]